MTVRIVDITNSYSDVGGGVRTYLRQMFAWFAGREGWSYALVAPGRENRTLALPGGRLHYVRGFEAAVEDGPTGYRLMWDARAHSRMQAVGFNARCLRQTCDEHPHLGYLLMKRFAQIMIHRMQAARLQSLDIYAPTVKGAKP